jgi:hypothetical protein
MMDGVVVLCKQFQSLGEAGVGVSREELGALVLTVQQVLRTLPIILHSIITFMPLHHR